MEPGPSIPVQVAWAFGHSSMVLCSPSTTHIFILIYISGRLPTIFSKLNSCKLSSLLSNLSCTFLTAVLVHAISPLRPHCLFFRHQTIQDLSQVSELVRMQAGPKEVSRRLLSVILNGSCPHRYPSALPQLPQAET